MWSSKNLQEHHSNVTSHSSLRLGRQGLRFGFHLTHKRLTSQILTGKQRQMEEKLQSHLCLRLSPHTHVPYEKVKRGQKQSSEEQRKTWLAIVMSCCDRISPYTERLSQTRSNLCKPARWVMGQRVKSLTTKADDLSPIPRIHTEKGGGGRGTLASCLLTSICTLCHTHMEQPWL